MIKNKLSFQEAKQKVIDELHLKEASIGEYQEKSIHSTLKNYFECDKDKQEVKISSFIADISNEYGIIEIQTRNFDKLRKKLEFFLENHEVTIVYPIISSKKIIWLESENEKDYLRTSPMHKNAFSSFKELYKIKYLLDNKNLHFYFVYLDLVELKNLDGWDKTHKKNATSVDKLPINIIKEEYYESISDFKKLFNNIDCEFTSKSLSKMTKSRLKDIQVALNVLNSYNVVKRIGKNRNEYVYKRIN